MSPSITAAAGDAVVPKKEKKDKKERKAAKEAAAALAAASTVEGGQEGVSSTDTPEKVKKVKKDKKERELEKMEKAAASPVESASTAPSATTTTAKPTTEDSKENANGRSRTTLFVSTIPYHATSDQLQEFFSDIGPVRSCFVVADRNADKEGRNKGYGYVSYALPEDAERAVKDLKKKKFMETRTLKVDFAVHKKVAEDRKAAGLSVNPDDPDRPKPKPKPRAVLPRSDPSASSTSTSVAPSAAPYKPRVTKQITVEVSGLPADVTQKQVYKKVRKYGEVVQVVYPVLRNDVAVPSIAHAVYRSEEDAKNAVLYLDGHQFKGAHINAKEVVAQDDLTRTAKQARLIVRNLPWQCEDLHLRRAFARFGKVVDILIPAAVDGKAKGFGFVQFETAKEAEAAIDAMNGQELIRRTIAVDWALPKAQYDRAIQGESQSAATVTKASTAAEQDVDSESPAEGDEGKVEKVQDGDESESEDEAQFYRDTIGGEGESDEDDEEIDSDAESSEDDEEDDDDLSSDDEDVPTKKVFAKPSVLASNVGDNCTLFIRNLSFDTTQDELTEAMSVFGALRYARITMDRATGRSRGTGFVCFHKKEDADACLVAWDKAYKASASLQSYNPTPDPKAQKSKKLAPTVSILAPEPSLTAGLTPFTVGGRFLNVTLAVNRADASQMAEDGKLRRRAEDQRNLYLMREGVIFPESEAAKTLTEVELEKRTSSFAERKRVLATNPNLFISRTRLSVRSLGAKVDDKELKKVAGIAVRKFWDEVGKGLREGMEPEVVKEEVGEGRPVPSGSRRAVITQAKILRSKDRVDQDTKLQKSKGYGFIEFESHADALACLRWMNNNPRAFRAAPVKDTPVVAPVKGKKGAKGKKVKQPPPPPPPVEETPEQAELAAAKGKRPIVEFAIENRQILKKRDERREQQAQRNGHGKRGRDDADGAAGGDDGPAKKKRFGEIWLERRLAAKAKKVAAGNNGATTTQPTGDKSRDGHAAAAAPTRKSDARAAPPPPASRPPVRGADSGRPSSSAPRPPKDHTAKRPRPDARHHDDGTVPDARPKPKKQKVPTKDQKKEASFDSLVQQYKKNLFGATAAKPASSASAATAAGSKPAGATSEASEKGIKRWFA
ncbi:RNA recognition motif-containing protein [Thoreauomyces humboldtii]|nr:RNA recognition motif-containing protein [Thoreauomyces humboldtii]